MKINIDPTKKCIVYLKIEHNERYKKYEKLWHILNPK